MYIQRFILYNSTSDSIGQYANTRIREAAVERELLLNFLIITQVFPSFSWNKWNYFRHDFRRFLNVPPRSLRNGTFADILGQGCAIFRATERTDMKNMVQPVSRSFSHFSSPLRSSIQRLYADGCCLVGLACVHVPPRVLVGHVQI